MKDLVIKPLRAVAARDTPALLEFHSPTHALAMTLPLRAARGTTWVVCTLVASCLAASILIPIDKVVTAQGRIIAQQASTVVQPLETAIVRSINVREGDVVAKGALLAQLDPTIATADVMALRSQVDSLQAEVARLTAESSETAYVPHDGSSISTLQGVMFMQRQAERKFKNENYSQKISSLQTQVQRAGSDAAGYSERLKVATEVEEKRLELERLKVGSQLNRLVATDSKLEVKRGLDGAVAQALQANRDLQAMRAERDGYNQQWRGQVAGDLTESSRKLSDAQENLNKAVLRRAMVEMHADKDSIVLNIAKVSPGSVMQSGEQLMTLVPVNAPLEAEVNVSGMDAGFVHLNNPVNIKLDTLPYTQYGTIQGQVRVISPDSFTSNADEAPKRGVTQNQSNGQPTPSFYRSRMSLDEVSLHDVPDGFRLIPGMPVTADIKVGKRTLASYLLSRVLPVFMDGMREP